MESSQIGVEKMKQWIVIAGLLLVLVTAGCIGGQANNSTSSGDGTITQADGTMVKPDGTMIKPDGTMIKPDGTMVGKEDGAMMEKGNVEYVPFTKAAYEQAKADGKTIFLEFYATWCPTCQAQAPALKEGLESISSEKLVAFRVNYRDSDTDADEAALAQKYNITYQHTHIVADASENVLLRSQEMWSKEEVKMKVGAFA